MLTYRITQAVKYIEQGHIRVGPQTITDPAYLVTRSMEDFVTWVDTSKVKRTVMTYNDEVRPSRPHANCSLEQPLRSTDAPADGPFS